MPGVGELDEHGRLTIWRRFVAEIYAQGPALGHRVAGVGHEIQKDLPEFLSIGQNSKRIGPKALIHHDLEFPQLMLHQVERACDFVVEIDRRDLLAPRMAELQQVGDKASHPLHFLFDDFERGSARIVSRSFRNDRFKSKADDSERVVQFVGDSRGQFADACELRGLPELLRRGAKFLGLGMEIIQGRPQMNVAFMQLPAGANLVEHTFHGFR